MKRDMELIREMLLAIEQEGEASEKIMESLPGVVAYHVSLLLDVGFIVGNVSNDAQGRPNRYFISRMTWQGHEFLDAIRDDSIWKKAKERVIKPGASWTFEVLKEWAKHEIKEKLGLPN